MTALGTMINRNPVLPQPVLKLVTDYTIERGNYIGVVQVRNAALPRATLHGNLATYIVRQISIVYRQLWPSHGQRFPQ